MSKYPSQKGSCTMKMMRWEKTSYIEILNWEIVEIDYDSLNENVTCLKLWIQTTR